MDMSPTKDHELQGALSAKKRKFEELDGITVAKEQEVDEIVHITELEEHFVIDEDAVRPAKSFRHKFWPFS